MRLATRLARPALHTRCSPLINALLPACASASATPRQQHRTLHCSASPSSGGAMGASDEAAPDYLTQEQARVLDERLMGPEGGYSVDQLMELAGLACAVAVEREFPAKATPVVVACGPGNNGGDGLVCARHLVQFGYTDVAVLLPKEVKPDSLYARLLQQAQLHGVALLGASSAEDGSLNARLSLPSAVVVDALFGFSFRPPLRDPFTRVVQLINASQAAVVSVDIPTGWGVESGPPAEGDGIALRPSVLVSLTAPKLCAKRFAGVHYVGGRFVPKGFAPFKLPAYPEGSDPVMKLSLPSSL